MKIRFELTRADVEVAIACELSRRLDRDITLEDLKISQDGSVQVEATWEESSPVSSTRRRKPSARASRQEDEMAEEDDWPDLGEEDLDEDSGDRLPSLSPQAQKLLEGEIQPQDVRGGNSRKRSRRRNMRHLGGR